MAIQEVQDGEVVEHNKEDKAGSGVTEISYGTWRIAPWKKDSWDKASGIELHTLVSGLLETRHTMSLLH